MEKIFHRLQKSELAKNTWWMLLGQGARASIQAIYFVLIARSLGVQGYGAFIGVVALVAILVPFASLGSGNILVQNVARDQTCFRRYWGKALVLTALTGGLLVLVVLLLSLILLPQSIPFLLVLSLSIADLIFTPVVDISAQAFQAFEKLARTSQLMILPNIVRLASLVVLLLLITSPSVTAWGFFYLAGNVISMIVGTLMVTRELGLPIIDGKQLFSEAREGLLFSISVSSQSIYNDIDKTMLTKLSTLQAAGTYGAAYRIIDVSFTPIRSLLAASYAKFFQVGSNGLRASFAYSLKLLPYALGYGFIVSVVLIAIAPILPHVLGKEYQDTVIALRWLSLIPLFRIFNFFAANSLTGAGFHGQRSFCQLMMAILNVAMIVWLIPRYSWKGAAWASIATDFLLAFALWTLVLWRLKNEVIAQLSA